MGGFDGLVLTIITAVPFGTAGVLILWPGERPTHWKYFSLAAAVTTAALSLYVLLQYDHEFASGDEKYQFLRQWEWLPSLGVSFHVGVYGISAVMIFMSGIVYVAAILMTWSTQRRVRDYLVLLHVLSGGVFGTFVAVDLFFLFFFYEIAVLPMFLLIAFWGSSSDNLRVFFSGWRTNFSRTKEYGAMKLVIFLVGGSVAIWIAILAIFVESGAESFDLIALQQTEYGEVFQRVFFPLLMFGFGLLAGLWPLHTWSPDGHVAAPTSMLHAGVLMKLGAYGIIRVGVELFPDGASDWGLTLVILGSINVVYGAVSAMSQRDLKYMIGYSSVSHMGYVLIGIGTLSSIGMAGAVLQMFAHGVMTALFFAIVGYI
jgi:NADH-quinone oxidoreductase subunit M